MFFVTELFVIVVGWIVQFPVIVLAPVCIVLIWIVYLLALALMRDIRAIDRYRNKHSK